MDNNHETQWEKRSFIVSVCALLIAGVVGYFQVTEFLSTEKKEKEEEIYRQKILEIENSNKLAREDIVNIQNKLLEPYVDLGIEHTYNKCDNIVLYNHDKKAKKLSIELRLFLYAAASLNQNKDWRLHKENGRIHDYGGDYKNGDYHYFIDTGIILKDFIVTNEVSKYNLEKFDKYFQLLTSKLLKENVYMFNYYNKDNEDSIKDKIRISRSYLPIIQFKISYIDQSKSVNKNITKFKYYYNNSIDELKRESFIKINKNAYLYNIQTEVFQNQRNLSTLNNSKLDTKIKKIVELNIHSRYLNSKDESEQLLSLIKKDDISSGLLIVQNQNEQSFFKGSTYNLIRNSIELQLNKSFNLSKLVDSIQKKKSEQNNEEKIFKVNANAFAGTSYEDFTLCYSKLKTKENLN